MFAALTDTACLFLEIRWMSCSNEEAQVQVACASVHRACAYLGCTNMRGSGEEKLARKCKKCSRCQLARYCGGECQRADWPHHKVACSLLRQYGGS